MSIINSAINPNSTLFQENAAAMETLVDDLAQKIASIYPGGPEKSRQHQTEQGKLLVHERIKQLLDPGSPFLELSQLAGYELYEDAVPAGGIITGIGQFTARNA